MYSKSKVALIRTTMMSSAKKQFSQGPGDYVLKKLSAPCVEVGKVCRMACLHWRTSGLLVTFTDIIVTSLLDMRQYPEGPGAVKMDAGTLETISNSFSSSATISVM